MSEVTQLVIIINGTGEIEQVFQIKSKYVEYPIYQSLETQILLLFTIPRTSTNSHFSVADFCSDCHWRMYSGNFRGYNVCLLMGMQSVPKQNVR